MNPPENPSAFPQGEFSGEHDGMTLRDYFAAAALTALSFSSHTDNPEYWKGVGKSCYQAADALLAERGKKE